MRVRLAPRIVMDSEIRSGKPVVEGTRVPVDLVLAKLGGGMSFSQISEEYDVTAEDILAVLAYAAHVVGNEEVRLAA